MRSVSFVSESSSANSFNLFRAFSLKDGCLGYAWILGEDARRAELAALYDALWQRDGYAEPLDWELLPALEAERARRVREDAAAVEPTRVDFFTLVRGED